MIFTTIWEIIKYIKNLFFGKPEKKIEYNLRKYSVFAIIILTFLHLITAILMLLSKSTLKENFIGLILGALFFWIFHIITTLLYLVFDFVIFKFQNFVNDKILTN